MSSAYPVDLCEALRRCGEHELSEAFVSAETTSSGFTADFLKALHDGITCGRTGQLRLPDSTKLAPSVVRARPPSLSPTTWIANDETRGRHRHSASMPVNTPSVLTFTESERVTAQAVISGVAVQCGTLRSRLGTLPTVLPDRAATERAMLDVAGALRRLLGDCIDVETRLPSGWFTRDVAQRYCTCVRELVLAALSLNGDLRTNFRVSPNESGVRLASSVLADQCRQLEDILRASERINLAAPM